MSSAYHPRASGARTSPLPAPQVLRTPPQVFGAYGPDGSAIPPPNFTEPIFAIDQMRLLADDGMSEAKRRRIARACDMCRKKKIKCDARMPKCTHCINYKTECIFTHVEKKRLPPKGSKYVEGLEKRLGRMESLLKLSGVLTDDDLGTDLAVLEKQLASRAKKHRRHASKSSASSQQAVSPVDESDDESAEGETSPKTSAFASPRTGSPSPGPGTGPEKRTEDEVEALSEMMCSLVTNNSGETRYIGSSSGFSIFSPRGIQWVNEKTGDTSFQETISAAVEDDSKWIHWKPDVFADIFHRRIFKPLPPKEEALSLLKDYFENFNCMFPLFHEPTFMHLVELQYSSQPYQGSGWWASLNVALAIAHRLRVMSNVVPQEEDQKGWAYLKNALGVLTELTMRNTDLLSVQALLGMSLFLQGTPNPQPSFFLVAAAIRLSHSIGLHKRGSGFNLREDEIEQRKRVFWIAYLVDKDLCLRSGRPPAQDDDDMNVELPSEDPPDNIGNIPLADGKGKINLFRLMCTFAVIESKVYKQLYSTKASRQSDGELLQTIGALDNELEEWKDGIPVDFRPECEIKASHTPLMLHVVVLHFAYYNCLTTIHRMAIHHGYWTSRLANHALQGLNARPLNPRVYSSATVCVTAARLSINLLHYIPQGDFACVWLILYFPVSALVTLFANILQNPQDPRARADLRLMSRVVSFLSMLSNDDDGTGGVRRMLGVCAEFERIASVVLDRAEQQTASRRKRKSHDLDARSQPNPNAPVNLQRQPAEVPTPHHLITPRQSVDIENPNLVVPPPTLPAGGTSPWVPGFTPTDSSSLLTPPSGQTPGLQESQAESFSFGPTINMDAFSQPFVPQDLWQMPMTLEWDWADMTTFGGPTTFGAGGGGGSGSGVSGAAGGVS